MGLIIKNKIKKNLSNTYLWRYMSLPKFLDLITLQQLYFATNTQLITGDPYEGTLPFFTDFLFNLSNTYNSLIKQLPESQKDLIKIDINGQKVEELTSKIKNIRDNTFINCWHIDDDENYLMWQSYAQESGAVAIVTDIESLCNAIQTDIEIDAVPITYGTKSFNKNVKDKNMDNEKELIKLIRLSSLYKKEFFKVENEIRLIYQFGNTNKVNIKLDELIKHIYLSPKSTEIERQIIINVLNLIKTNGNFNVDIEKIVSNSFISHTYKESTKDVKTTMAILSNYLNNIDATDEDK